MHTDLPNLTDDALVLLSQHSPSAFQSGDASFAKLTDLANCTE